MTNNSPFAHLKLSSKKAVWTHQTLDAPAVFVGSPGGTDTPAENKQFNQGFTLQQKCTAPPSEMCSKRADLMQGAEQIHENRVFRVEDCLGIIIKNR
ncbi:MAG: hypothetical protein QNJ36_17300 [Calothrix sp. MO_167.B42]|nr:hypothetical protein [Calothrix sp. MO_167.B42]